MMKDKQNLNKNNGKGMQTKHPKNAGNPHKQAKNNKCMKKVQDLLVYS